MIEIIRKIVSPVWYAVAGKSQTILDVVSQSIDLLTAAVVVWLTRGMWVAVAKTIPLIGDSFAAGITAGIVGVLSVGIAFHVIRVLYGTPSLGAVFTAMKPLAGWVLSLVSK